MPPSADMQDAADKGQQVFKAAGAEWITPTAGGEGRFRDRCQGSQRHLAVTVKLTGFDATAYMDDAFAILAGYKVTCLI